MTPASVGVDLGGTWLRVCAADGRGRPLRTARLTAPPIDALARALRSLWRRWRVEDLPRLVVGSKGAWRREKKRAMARSLRGLARRVTVMSDVELAYRNALGEGPGLLILAGTGSIALARTRGGKWIRAGGLGPARGDEGSGYWIGREHMARVLGKPAPPVTPENVRRTAARASRLVGEGGPIVAEAQSHLARLGAGLLKRISRGGKVRAAWAGGLMENRKFRNGVFLRLRSMAPNVRIKPVAPSPTPYSGFSKRK